MVLVFYKREIKSQKEGFTIYPLWVHDVEFLIGTPRSHVDHKHVPCGRGCFKAKTP
jgi:hypothetical protein